ncbi:MAG: MBL fold metallo-hydrolase [Clostridia bacterium]|nr:MBL fold metallo-hydrolase [Clostridia bacterium]
MKLKVEGYPVGYMATNCYLVTDTQTDECFIVDPGTYDASLKKLLQDVKEGKLRYILLTHGHFDHIMGVFDVQKNYGGKIVIHEKDADCFTNEEKSLLDTFGFDGELPEQADVIVRDGDKLPFADGAIEVMHTPGHTEGSVCYLIGDKIFSGDTLFYGSVGRTDFKSGSFEEIIKSVKRLASLEGDRKVYPGHNMLTTLDNERKHNVYLKDAK